MNVKKVSKAKIATTYANALYAAAVEKNNLEQIFADVHRLVSSVSDEFVSYMSSPLWSDEDKADVLRQVAKKVKINDETLRCLEVVMENRRFGELSDILRAFEHVYYQKKNIIEVAVDSVKPLSSAQDKKLRTNLEKSLGQKVVVAYSINPEILGGLRIRFGSDMIDDTLIQKLNRLEIMMKGE